MHYRFKERIEAVARAREDLLCRSLAILAQSLEGIDDCPPHMPQALRALATALSLCPYDERGRSTRLRLLGLALPALNQIVGALEARHATGTFIQRTGGMEVGGMEAGGGVTPPPSSHLLQRAWRWCRD